MFSILNKLIYDKKELLFFTHPNPKEVYSTPQLTINSVNDFSSFKDRAAKIFKYPLAQPLYWRFMQNKATLLTIESEGKIDAYGFIQDWSLFNKRYGSMYKDSVMLGPFWVAPNHRGKGYYGMLLKESLKIVNHPNPCIFTTRENEASIKGIKKAGFEELGLYQIVQYFRIFVKVKKL